MDGKQFGQLTVIVEASPIAELQWNKARTQKVSVMRRAWHCVCSCGIELVVKQNFLRQGYISGCKRCAKISRSRNASVRLQSKEVRDRVVQSYIKKNSKTGLELLYNHYKLGSARREIPFNLTIEEFGSISSEDCVYCGEPPSLKTKKRSSRMEACGYSHYIYNSIDRVDSSIGYVKSNCVPACKMCNMMKRDYEVSQFLEQVRKIARWTERRKSNESSLYVDKPTG